MFEVNIFHQVRDMLKFLLFSRCFPQLYIFSASKCGIVWQWVRQSKISFEKGRKHCGKRRKCWLPAFSPFPTMFSKVVSFRVVKSQDCVVRGILGNPSVKHSDTFHSLPLGQLTSKLSFLVNIHMVRKYPNSQLKDR